MGIRSWENTLIDMVPPWPEQGGHFYCVKTGHFYCRSTAGEGTYFRTVRRLRSATGCSSDGPARRWRSRLVSISSARSKMTEAKPSFAKGDPQNRIGEPEESLGTRRADCMIHGIGVRKARLNDETGTPWRSKAPIGCLPTLCACPVHARGVRALPGRSPGSASATAWTDTIR
jgi:hypothetical protein